MPSFWFGGEVWVGSARGMTAREEEPGRRDGSDITHSCVGTPVGTHVRVDRVAVGSSEELIRESTLTRVFGVRRFPVPVVAVVAVVVALALDRRERLLLRVDIAPGRSRLGFILRLRDVPLVVVVVMFPLILI